MNYPNARKGNVVEDYHGTIVADPYRWIENPESIETKEWVEQQNKLTNDFIKSIPKFEDIKQRMKELWNYPKRGVPFKEGDRYFFMKNDGLQNHAVLYYQESLGDVPKLLLDPNTWSKYGTIALSRWSVSKDGKLLAYAVSEKGSDWQQIKVLDIDSNKVLDDLIEWCKFTDISWLNDSSGFFYGRYPRPTGQKVVDENSNNKVYYHKIGNVQEEDVLIHEDVKDPDRHFDVEVTDDGKYVLIDSMSGTGSTNTVHYRGINEIEFHPIFLEEDAQYSFIDNVGEIFYFQTDKDAPRKRVISYNLNTKEVKDVVSEQEDTLYFCYIINDKLILVYMKDAHHIIKVYSLEGKYIKDLELPFLGTIGSMSGKRGDKEFFFSLTSFLSPSTIFRYNFDELKVYHKTKANFDLSNYETKQLLATSKDGTKVPMFITSKKGIDLDSKNPVLMHGYGGFNVSVLPRFSVSVTSWLDLGGIYVETNLRGGSEYGSSWHKAGMRDNKQNVFDDFIACGEYLIDNNYTSNKKLAIIGASNGGLLVAACMTQRPDLFGGIICQVPVIDMLRYHKFTVGKYWIEEYGNAELKEDFPFLYKYSPLHNAKETSYPNTLILTADHDDRVVSAHAKKFAASLQANNQGGNSILVHVETSVGHGAGKSTEKMIDERSMVYAFLYKVLEF